MGKKHSKNSLSHVVQYTRWDELCTLIRATQKRELIKTTGIEISTTKNKERQKNIVIYWNWCEWISFKIFLHWPKLVERIMIIECAFHHSVRRIFYFRLSIVSNSFDKKLNLVFISAVYIHRIYVIRLTLRNSEHIWVKKKAVVWMPNLQAQKVIIETD